MLLLLLVTLLLFVPVAAVGIDVDGVVVVGRGGGDVNDVVVGVVGVDVGVVVVVGVCSCWFCGGMW